MKHFEYRKASEMMAVDRELASALDELSIVQTSDLTVEPKLDNEAIEQLARELDRVHQLYDEIKRDDPFAPVLGK